MTEQSIDVLSYSVKKIRK